MKTDSFTLGSERCSIRIIKPSMSPLLVIFRTAFIIGIFIPDLSAQVEVVTPGQSAISDGNAMSNSQDARSGIVRFSAFPSAGGSGGSCTGAILKTSKVTNETWILTAAHCFYNILEPAQRVFPYLNPGNRFNIDVEYGANLNRTLSFTGQQAIIHPDWESHVNGGNGIWYDHPDLALIHLPGYIPVLNADGLEYVEYTRPFFSGVIKNYEGNDLGVFGAKGSLKWARGRFTISSSGYLVIDGNDWKTDDAKIEHGDSGGPWLYATGEKSSSDHYINNGVIVGVTSGPHLDISPGSLTQWPIDWFGMGTATNSPTNFILNNTSNVVPQVDNLPWKRNATLQYSSKGTSSWKRLPNTSRNTGDVKVAEFGSNPCDNGIPKDDVFLAENGRWFISWCGTTEWEPVQVSGTEIEDDYGLAFGDFNGDGITDVFRASGGKWKVSYSARRPWADINTSETRMTDSKGLAFGDFNGDGITDVFRASGGSWKVSYSGTQDWVNLINSDTELKDKYGLAFGDFNGDGITDVFRASGGEWKVSYSGNSQWTKLNSSSTELTDTYGLVFGYLNNDKKVDVLRGNGSSWKVCYGGTGSWAGIGSSETISRRLAVGELTGDNTQDVVLVRNERTCFIPAYNINLCSNYYYLYNTDPSRCFSDLDNDLKCDEFDADDDNDGILDTADNCPAIANSLQTDNNRNGRGLACDAFEQCLTNCSPNFPNNGPINELCYLKCNNFDRQVNDLFWLDPRHFKMWELIKDKDPFNPEFTENREFRQLNTEYYQFLKSKKIDTDKETVSRQLLVSIQNIKTETNK